MTEDKKPPVDDDVPEGFTLVTPGAAPASSGAAVSDLPSGFTDVTPKDGGGGGILQNPGGDVIGSRTQTQVGNMPDVPQEKSVSDFVLNKAPQSAINSLQNLVHAGMHPIDTAWNAGKLVAGAIRATARAAGAEIDDNEADQTARNFAEYAKKRWGGVDQIKEALYNDPAGMLMDFSAAMSGAGGVLRGAGALSGIEAASTLGRTATTLGEVTNPLYLPSKAAGATIRGLTRKPPASVPEPTPAFDPKTATFAGDEAFDPSTGTFGAAPGSGYQSPKPKAPPAAAPPESMQDSVNRLRAEWGVKPPKSGIETPEPEPAAAPPPKAKPAAAPPPPSPAAPPAAGSKIADVVRGALKNPLSAGAIGYEAINLLSHHLLGSVSGGFMVAGALKYLPQLLKSEAGQQMLARLGPGSNAATVAGVAKDLVPALNTLYQSQLQQQSMGQHSALGMAAGGRVNPELARIQRERLPRLGVLGMLENSHN